MTDPLVLGFDTSGAYCAAALVRGGTILEQTSVDMAKGQAENLMGILEGLLERHTATWANLDALGVGIGPGNFTGIRISVSAARGLALGLGVPAYGIDGFDQRALVHAPQTLICVPAPRDSFYVRRNGTASLMPRAEAEAFDEAIRDDPAPDALAASIARLAAARFPAHAPAPAPYYLRAPDAAPAKDAPPVLLS